MYAKRIAFFVTLLLGISFPTGVLADGYTQGTYSSCDYGTHCTSSTTVTTIPSGLQLAINLTSGQNIPLSGYTITVTPLNGQGATIEKVVFYINNQLVFTSSPDELGTARWHWVPPSLGKVQMQVVIYGTDGSQTTDDFSLHIVATNNATTPHSSIPENQSIINRIGHSVRHAAQSIIRHIPVPIVYSFPYLLFIALGIFLLFLAAQVKREIGDALALRASVEREHQITSEKDTFLQLGEHYLRTPVTLIRGGIEMVSLPNGPESVHNEVATQATKLANALSADIEAVITRLSSNETFTAISNADIPRPQRIWLAAGFLVPAIGLLALLGITQYLVENIRQLNVTFVNQMVQAIVTAILLLTLYQILRRRRLRDKEMKALKHTQKQQQAIDEVRNAFIKDSAGTLTTDIQQLDSILQRLPSSQATASIQEGTSRLRKVIDQFTIASRLALSQSQSPPTMLPVTTLFEDAKRIANKTLTIHRNVVRTESAVTSIACRQPTWLPLVIGSLLDNASAYSPEGASIELSAKENEVFVTDHGSGIAESTLNNLFKPFVKAEGALNFTHEGLGFSLYLDKLIMTYLGGDITIQSTINQGTTVTLILPPIA